MADVNQGIAIQERTELHGSFSDSTYEIISKVAYLIGVPKRIFENIVEAPKMEYYDLLQADKAARIIRNLCVIRTSILRKYRRINEDTQRGFGILSALEAHLPPDSLKELNLDGIQFIRHSNIELYQHVIEINKIISDRINNCKPLFPIWINWEYIKNLFIMPDGLSDEGERAAVEVYYTNIRFYPYQMYLNWSPKDEGNILYNDKKFVALLYNWNNDQFLEFSKVSDVAKNVKRNIYEFINAGQRVMLVVDCENSDPYKLCAVLKNLDKQYTQKITQILLFDDVHAATAWRILEEFTQIPVEHIMTERVKQNKSLVDIKLTARACQEHYKNGVDSFIIVSSDSDYWGLITSMPTARFLVMVEHGRCGPNLKNALETAEIFYCYIDDFYSGNAESIKRTALFREMQRYLNRRLQVNVNSMFQSAITATRIEMTEAEQKQFFNRYIKTMKMYIAENGDVELSFKG